MTMTTTDEQCLDCGTDKGVEFHMLPDRDDFKAFPRCDACFTKRLDRAERNLELMSPCRAPWFDPGFAGERWEDD